MTAPGSRIVTSPIGSRPFCSDTKLHRAVNNVWFELRGKISEATAEDFGRTTKNALLDIATELQLRMRPRVTGGTMAALPAASDGGRTSPAFRRRRRWDAIHL